MTTPPSARAVRSLMAALLASCIAFQLNATMVSPALNTMAHALHTDTATIGLTQTAFFVSAAVFSTFGSRLGDIKGRRKILTVALTATMAGNVLSALAPTVELLFAGRILAGLSGPVIGTALLMLRSAVTDARRYGTLMGVVVAVNGGVAGIDTLVGGFLTSHVGFRSVFWVMACSACLATLLVVKRAPETRPAAGTRMDWLGVGPLLLATAGLLLGLETAGQLGHADWVLVSGLLGLAIVAAAAFLIVEHKVPAPLIRPEHLRQRGTWAVLLTTTLTLCGIFATVNGIVVDFAQNSRIGYDLEPGMASLLLLTPYALIGWVVGPFAGRLAPTLGYGKLLRIGLLGSIVAIALMATVGLHSLPALIAATLLIGIAYAGIANITLSGLVVVLAPPDNPGFLPGMSSSAFNLGAALSFAVLPVIQSAGSDAGSQSTAGYSGAMLVGLIITALALATSYLIPKPLAGENTGTHSDSHVATTTETTS